MRCIMFVMPVASDVHSHKANGVWERRTTVARNPQLTPAGKSESGILSAAGRPGELLQLHEGERSGGHEQEPPGQEVLHV